MAAHGGAPLGAKVPTVVPAKTSNPYFKKGDKIALAVAGTFAVLAATFAGLVFFKAGWKFSDMPTLSWQISGGAAASLVVGVSALIAYRFFTHKSGNPVEEAPLESLETYMKAYRQKEAFAAEQLAADNEVEGKAKLMELAYIYLEATQLGIALDRYSDDELRSILRPSPVSRAPKPVADDEVLEKPTKIVTASVSTAAMDFITPRLAIADRPWLEIEAEKVAKEREKIKADEAKFEYNDLPFVEREVRQIVNSALLHVEEQLKKEAKEEALNNAARTLVNNTILAAIAEIKTEEVTARAPVDAQEVPGPSLGEQVAKNITPIGPSENKVNAVAKAAMSIRKFFLNLRRK
jgi:hypothetical protein